MFRANAGLGLLAITALILGGAAIGDASAAYPERPIQLILPFPAGGSADVLGRVLAKELEPRLGQPVVVINKAGGGTVIAAQAVASSAPDGYTLFISSNTTFSINPAVLPNLPYNSATSFDPIAMLTRSALAIVAHPSLPFSNVGQLVSGAKAAPDKYFYASFGNATVSHFAAEMFKAAAGVKLEHVPYKGSGPAMTDLVGGQVPLLFDTVVAALPQLKSGRVKVLAVTTATRSAQLPDVPTIAESGYPGFEIASLTTLVGPAGLPGEVKSRLDKELSAIMQTPDVRERLIGLGFEPAYSRVTDWANMVNADIAKMKAIAVSANIKPD